MLVGCRVSYNQVCDSAKADFGSCVLVLTRVGREARYLSIERIILKYHDEMRYN